MLLLQLTGDCSEVPLRKQANMGNEASFHMRGEEEGSSPKKGGRILRSSSLKSQRPHYSSNTNHQQPTRQRKEEDSLKEKEEKEEVQKTMPGLIRSKFSLKRSNTFTSFNTFKKPLFPTKLANDDKRTADEMQTTKSKEVSKLMVEEKGEDDVTDFIKDEGDDTIVDQEKLFIPRKENHSLEKKVDQSSHVIREAERKEEMRVARNSRHAFLSNSSRITLKMNKPDEENKSNKVTKDEEKTTLLLSCDTKESTTSNVDSCSIDSKEDKAFSKIEETQSNHSTIFEEHFEKNMSERFSTPDTSEGEEETRRHSFTPAERRKKNVLRSQSMNYQMNRPKLSVQHHRSSSIDDGIDDVTTVNNIKGSESPTVGLGSRRRSDTSLLKEQHVKRSEQFTQMLKQYQQQNEKKTKLSSYGLGAIAENSSKEQQVTRKPKLRRRNEYFDFWLKDQSDRINNLSVAAKGDADEIRSLRASFRERPLQTSQKDLLPKRPSSVKLPRRNQNTTAAFVSSSDSEDLDLTVAQLKLVDTNGNFINKQQTKNPLKKQLTDTLLLVDKSFKNSTLSSDPSHASSSSQRLNQQNMTSSKTNGSIRFCSTPTSSVVARASNIAVVKPMKREVSENVVQVNTVKILDDGPLIEARCSSSSYNDPLGLQVNDKQLIKQEEQRRKRVFVRSSSFDNKPQMVSHSSITRTKSDSVDPISKSLNKVMGDLKTLRNQDITLAKQLLGLGKSIQDFKEEQYFSQTETESLI